MFAVSVQRDICSLRDVWSSGVVTSHRQFWTGEEPSHPVTQSFNDITWFNVPTGFLQVLELCRLNLRVSSQSGSDDVIRVNRLNTDTSLEDEDET